MAATLMPFARPEQELFAHLRSFESYQSQKPPQTSLRNIPRSEACEQCSTTKFQKLLSKSNTNSMPERLSNDLSNFGSFHVFTNNKPAQEKSPDHQSWEEPSWDENDRNLIISSQKTKQWRVPVTSGPGSRPIAPQKHSESHNDKANKRPRLERKYASLLDDTDTTEPPFTRRCIERSTRIGARAQHNTTFRRPSSTISTAPQSIQSFDSCHPPKTTNTRRLQPILRSSGAQLQKAQRPKRRVSFSVEDQVVVFDQEDEAPVKEACNDWKIDKLPSRKEWEEQLAELGMEEPSAYENHTSIDDYRPSYKHGRDKYPSAAYLDSDEVPCPAPGSGLRRAKSPVPRREFPAHYPWEKPPLHKHRHVDVNCKHEIVDPMPCSCEEPEKVYDGKFTNCRDCAAIALRNLKKKEHAEKAVLREKERVNYEGWWTKLTKKLAF